MNTYHVLKDHFGSKPYKVGGTREANAADVAHLVAMGLLGLKPLTKTKVPSEAKAAAEGGGDK